MSAARPRVLLFRPKSAYGVVYMPWSLLAIAAPLVEDGVSVRIIDENADDNWRETLRAELGKNPVCLGVTSLTGRMLAGGVEASRMAHGRTPVVWGGVHASLLPEQTVSAPCVDYVIAGEGEKSFPMLVKRLMGDGEGPEDIPGLYYKAVGARFTRRGGRALPDGEGGENEDAPVDVRNNAPGPFIDLAEEPPPPYELVDADNYVSGWFAPGSRVLDIFTSRGCPHRCKFCYNPAFNARKWRSLNPDVACERIKEFVKRFKLTGIIVRDDFYFANPQRAAAISRKMLEKGLNIEWEADCRVDIFSTFDDDFLSLMVESGLKKLVFGVESGSPKVLEDIGKDITIEQLWKTVDALKRHGINAAFHFMIGFPGETAEQALETYRLIDRLKREMPRAPIYGPNIYVPYPGTELFDKAVELRFEPPKSLEGWVDFEGWTVAKAPWVDKGMESFLDVSRIYFRMGEVFPSLKPVERVRRALWGKSPYTPWIERKTLNLALAASAGTWIRRLHLKRWADKKA